MTRFIENVTAKCAGIDCDLRNDCLRFVAPSLPDQHWYSFYAEASFTPDEGCDYILPVLPDDPSNAMREAA
jgi:hypothetical protein